MIHKTAIFLFLFLGYNAVFAQNHRFSGHYPLTTPKSLPEQKADFEKTLTAIAGGIIMIEDAPTSKEDPEALTKQDYLASIDEMIAYALELAASLENTMDPFLKKAAKAIKSAKYEEAIDELKECGATTIGQGSEEVFFIWKSYLADKKSNAPWLIPDNIEISKRYRLVISYVTKNYDRPFGMQAEIGAVVADAAQALSNSLEDPQSLTWKGEGELSFKQQDEMRRLASDVSYYEWRLHDPTNAQRSAAINILPVQHIQLALFDMVRSIMSEKSDWSKDPAHGTNLQQLCYDVKTYGWTVDGEKAKKTPNEGGNGTTVSNKGGKEEKPKKKVK